MEDAIAKAVTDSTGQLCNVATLAAKLNTTANNVKQHFPLDSAERIVTGRVNDGFAIVLLRSSDPSRKTSSVDEIWSSHGYQTCVDIGVKERNAMYIDLLTKRPPPVIRGESAIRENLRRSDGSKNIDKEKASAESFFTEKKTDVKKAGGIANMFNNTNSTNKKSGKEDFKDKTNSQMKTEKKVKDEPATITEKPKSQVSSGKKPDNNDKLTKTLTSGNNKNNNDNKNKIKAKVEVTKFTDKNESSDVEMTEEHVEDSEVKSVKTQKDKKISPKGRRPSEKRKQISPEAASNDCDSDDELIVSRKNKKKKRRVAFESDSEDEDANEKNKQSSSEDSGKNSKNKSSSRKDISIKNSSDEENNKTTTASKQVNQAKPPKPDDSKQVVNGKKRRRVLKEVTHTFKDAEGYLQTKITKEMVSETDSEYEDPTKKASSMGKAKSSVAKPAPKGQASLFSFFKKQ